MDTMPELVPPFENDRLHQVLFQRDSQSGNNSHPLVVLNALPFNHLGVWAYIAFGFIVIASFMVICYMVYSCCYSAGQRQNYRNEPRTGERSGIVRIKSLRRPNALQQKEIHESRKPRWRRVLSTDGWLENGKKKYHMDGWKFLKRKSGWKWLLSKDYAGDIERSDSSRKMTHVHSSASNTSSNVHDQSFEMEGQRLSTPPLAHTSDKAGPYIPFHLPPPPSSPTLAHKKHLDRQRHAGYQRPSSSTPSYVSNESHPSLTKESTDKAPHRHRRSRLRGPATIDTAGISKQMSELVEEFDSNNIRYAPPRNPFMTPPNELLWNESKLSPIGGAIISPTNTLSSAAESNPFAEIIPPRLAEDISPPATPTHAVPRTRLLSPRLSPKGGDDNINRHFEVETQNPISSSIYRNAHLGHWERNGL